MPPTFVARRAVPPGQGQVQFKCPLKCTRCKGKSKSAAGKQCKRQVCMGQPWCWQHVKSAKQLHRKVTPHIPGGANKGLFAWNPAQAILNQPVFKPGDVIYPSYDGEVVSQKQLNQRYDFPRPPPAKGHYSVSAPYGIGVKPAKKKKHLEDGACKRGNIAFTNDFRPGPPSGRNAALVQTGALVATKRIFHGHEILVDYGTQYWKDSVCPARQYKKKTFLKGACLSLQTR